MEAVELELGGERSCDPSSSLNLFSGVPSLKAEEGTCASVLHKSLSILPQNSKY